MKRLATCHCGGKIIQNGVGNVFCASCSDRILDEKLSEWANRKEKHMEGTSLTNQKPNKLCQK